MISPTFMTGSCSSFRIDCFTTLSMTTFIPLVIERNTGDGAISTRVESSGPMHWQAAEKGEPRGAKPLWQGSGGVPQT